MSNVDKVRELANNASSFVENFASEDSEYIQIYYTDDEIGCFYGRGEVSGDDYRIESNTKTLTWSNLSSSSWRR